MTSQTCHLRTHQRSISLFDHLVAYGKPPNALSSFRLLASERPEDAGRRAMLLPVQYAWFEPVLIATIVVFIIDLVGNAIGFGNRFLGALMSAIVFAVVFGTLVFRLRQRVDVSDDDAEYNCPCSNAKVGRPNGCSPLKSFVVSVGVGLARAICEMRAQCASFLKTRPCPPEP